MAQLQNPKSTPTELAPNYKLARDKDSQKVRGKFIFHECPGGIMEFVYRKFKGDSLVPYRLKDGDIATIPLGVARHLNTECAYPNYTYKNDEQGRPVVTVSQKIRRCSFQSLEFIDVDIETPKATQLPDVPLALGK